MKTLLALLLFAVGWNAAAQGNSEAILSYTNNGETGFFSGTTGWAFQVTNTVTVLELGCLADFFPNNQTTSPVEVGLWGTGASPLASAFISPTSTSRGQSLYASIAEISLTPGVAYRIGMYFAGLSYSLNVVTPDLGGSVTTDPRVVVAGGARGTDGFASPPPDGTPAGAAYLGPNFYFRNVPEPASTALLLLGTLLVAIRRRVWRR